MKPCRKGGEVCESYRALRAPAYHYRAFRRLVTTGLSACLSLPGFSSAYYYRAFRLGQSQGTTLRNKGATPGSWLNI